jgi:drug/metabolite transporter (DMT)-like permease
MKERFFQLDWFDLTEAWAPLFPLLVWLWLGKDAKKKLQPTQWYFICALVLNTAIDFIWKFNDFIPVWAQNNNLLYNLQSPLRVGIMVYFFQRLLVPRYQKVARIALGLYAAFLLINYSLFQNIAHYSSRANTAEPLVVILVCLLYLFQMFADDEILSYRKNPAIYLAIGLLIYEMANFAIFLFYSHLIVTSEEFAVQIWHVHNAFYLLFCLLSAKGYYESRH